MFNSILSILYRDKVSNVKNEMSKMSKIIAVGLYHGGAVGLLVAKTCALDSRDLQYASQTNKHRFLTRHKKVIE